MYVVASLLNPAASLQTQEIWQSLEDGCGLAGIKLTPLPHFSWQSAAEYDFDRLEMAIRTLAEEERPFHAHTTGLGIFTGANPVLYTSLVKNRRLFDLQESIWQVAAPLATRLNPHYEPSAWVPHITLAYRDITRENLACGIQDLAFQPIGMEILVDHLALIYEVDGQFGIKFRYDFSRH